MAAGIETVRPFVINRTATTQAQALCVVTAYRALDLIFYRPTAGLLGYDIDHAAYGPFPIDDRGRPAQHLYALDRPGIERIGDADRSEEHTSELQALMRHSYA